MGGNAYPPLVMVSAFRVFTQLHVSAVGVMSRLDAQRRCKKNIKPRVRQSTLRNPSSMIDSRRVVEEIQSELQDNTWKVNHLADLSLVA